LTSSGAITPDLRLGHLPDLLGRRHAGEDFRHPLLVGRVLLDPALDLGPVRERGQFLLDTSAAAGVQGRTPDHRLPSAFTGLGARAGDPGGTSGQESEARQQREPAPTST
jgi:hypothetical protein